MAVLSVRSQVKCTRTTSCKGENAFPAFRAMIPLCFLEWHVRRSTALKAFCTSLHHVALGDHFGNQGDRIHPPAMLRQVGEDLGDLADSSFTLTSGTRAVIPGSALLLSAKVFPLR